MAQGWTGLWEEVGVGPACLSWVHLLWCGVPPGSPEGKSRHRVTWVSLPLVPVSVYSVHLSLPLAVRCVCPGMRLPCISVCWCVCVSLSLACVSLCVCVSLSGFLCVSVYFFQSFAIRSKDEMNDFIQGYFKTAHI